MADAGTIHTVAVVNADEDIVETLRLLLEAAEGRQFLLMTTNKDALERAFGKTEEVEMIGKPFYLEEVVGAVKNALKP